MVGLMLIYSLLWPKLHVVTESDFLAICLKLLAQTQLIRIT